MPMPTQHPSSPQPADQPTHQPGQMPGAPGTGPGLDRARKAVRQAIDMAGLTLKQASRLLGRNDAYLQQYLYRGSPRRLPEEVRLRLAEMTGDRADSLTEMPGLSRMSSLWAAWAMAARASG